MAVDSDLVRAEILHNKNSTYALIFTDQSKDTETIKGAIDSLPKCCFDEKRLTDITKIYKEIKDGMNFSIEDVYNALSITPESDHESDVNLPILSNYKRDCIKNYRNHIIRILQATKTQVELNRNKVDVCSIAQVIFKKSQKYKENKPRFIANLWFLGNSKVANKLMKQAFETYTLAPQEMRLNDNEFCANCLIDLFSAYERSVTDSFRIHYLDHVIDQIYNWYFVEPDKHYDFLIFNPDIFDDIKNYLLELIDKNPLCFYVKMVGTYYQKIDANEGCLDADKILYMQDADFSQASCIRKLQKLYNEYFDAYQAFKQYGMYSCECYNISDYVSANFGKTPETKDIHHSAIANLLTPTNLVISFNNVISDQPKFIRQHIKPILTSIDHPPLVEISQPIQPSLL